VISARIASLPVDLPKGPLGIVQYYTHAFPRVGHWFKSGREYDELCNPAERIGGIGLLHLHKTKFQHGPIENRLPSDDHRPEAVRHDSPSLGCVGLG